jgi:hypothetical protein
MVMIFYDALGANDVPVPQLPQAEWLTARATSSSGDS